MSSGERGRRRSRLLGLGQPAGTVVNNCGTVTQEVESYLAAKNRNQKVSGRSWVGLGQPFFISDEEGKHWHQSEYWYPGHTAVWGGKWSAVTAQLDMELAGAVDMAGVGKMPARRRGLGKRGHYQRGSLRTISKTNPEVMVDFTTPLVVMENIRVAAEAGVAGSSGPPV